jgi:uncharacterized protein DUF6398
MERLSGVIAVKGDGQPVGRPATATVSAITEVHRNHQLAHGARAPSRAEEIIKITYDFCAAHLDAECGRLCAKLVRGLSRHRSSPLEGGQTRVWAGAVIKAIGEVNFLFNPTRHPHLKFDDLSRLIGVSKSALATRARFIMNLLRIMPFEPAYCHRERFAQNPLARMVEGNGRSRRYPHSAGGRARPAT